MRKSQPAGCTLVQNHPFRVDTPPAQVRSPSAPPFAIEEDAQSWGGYRNPGPSSALTPPLHGWALLSLWAAVLQGAVLTSRSLHTSTLTIGVWDRCWRTKISLLSHPLPSQKVPSILRFLDGAEPSPHCCMPGWRFLHLCCPGQLPLATCGPWECG